MLQQEGMTRAVSFPPTLTVGTAYRYLGVLGQKLHKTPNTVLGSYLALAVQLVPCNSTLFQSHLKTHSQQQSAVHVGIRSRHRCLLTRAEGRAER